MSKKIKQAVILAGGLGKRLRPLTNDRPKPMVLINNRPFLEYLIGLLRKNGIEEIILCLGYMPEKITEYFGDGSRYGVNIKYSIGHVSDETGKRLRDASALLAERFLFMFGDNYWPLDIDAMSEFYGKMNALVSITIYRNKDGLGEYGYENTIWVQNDNYVGLYDRTRSDSRLNGIDIGFYILSKDILKILPEHNFHFEIEILPKLIKKRELVGYYTNQQYYSLTNLGSIKRIEEFLKPKKVIFIDRDGVINKKMPEHDYVKRWEEFEFLPGVIDALKILTNNNYQIYVITNQRGVARGFMNEETLKNIHDRMDKELAEKGVQLKGIYYCPHDENECECRKPKEGLFFRTAGEHCLDLTKSIFIGDSQSDLIAGEKAGCKTFLIDSKTNLLDIVISLIKK